MNRRGLYCQLGSLFAMLFIFTVFIIIIVLSMSYGIGGSVVTSSATANATATYLVGQLGASGLASWLPVIIAIAIGTLFISSFMFRKGM